LEKIQKELPYLAHSDFLCNKEEGKRLVVVANPFPLEEEKVM